MRNYFTGILCCLLVVTAVVQSCKKITFVNTVATTFTNNVTVDSGCLEPGFGLDNAWWIAVKNESVPVLYEEAVRDLTYLQVLNLDFNEIEEITPGAFQNLPALRELTLKGNKIRIIKEGIFNGLAVAYLRLSNNDISVIEPGAFNGMGNLELLEADFNKLSSWNPSWFTNSQNVRKLSFAHNEISSLPPYAFKNIKKHNLGIDLSSNNISTVDSLAFDGLDVIGILDLSKNSITALPPSVFSTAERLDFLLLQGNQIHCLSEDFLKTLPPVGYNIQVDDNPWNCTCLHTVRAWSKLHNDVVRSEYAYYLCRIRS